MGGHTFHGIHSFLKVHARCDLPPMGRVVTVRTSLRKPSCCRKQKSAPLWSTKGQSCRWPFSPAVMAAVLWSSGGSLARPVQGCLESVPMLHFVLANLFKTLGSGGIADSVRLLGELTVHRFHLVRLALDGVLEILRIIGDDAGQPRFFCEMLEALGVGSRFKQSGQFQVAAFARVLGVEHVLGEGEGLSMHGRRQVLGCALVVVRFRPCRRGADCEKRDRNGGQGGRFQCSTLHPASSPEYVLLTFWW